MNNYHKRHYKNYDAISDDAISKYTVIVAVTVLDELFFHVIFTYVRDVSNTIPNRTATLEPILYPITPIALNPLGGLTSILAVVYAYASHDELSEILCVSIDKLSIAS